MLKTKTPLRKSPVKKTTEGKPKESLAGFLVRRIANRNPRHARGFLRLHRRIMQVFTASLLVICMVGGIWTWSAGAGGEELQSKLSTIQKIMVGTAVVGAGAGVVGKISDLMAPSNGKTGANAGDKNGGGALSTIGSIAKDIKTISGTVGEVSKSVGETAGAIADAKCEIDRLKGKTNSPACKGVNGNAALAGLEAFKGNYAGNKHGSAIGMITGWTNFVLPFVSVLAIAALVYAGFLYITAMGNDENIQKAKKILIWVIVGIILIFSAYAIVNTVLSANSTT